MAPGIKINDSALTFRSGLSHPRRAQIRRTDVNDPAKWISKPEAAARLGLTEVSVWRNVRDGRLTAYRGPVYGSNRATRILAADVASLAKLRDQQAQQ